MQGAVISAMRNKKNKSAAANRTTADSDLQNRLRVSDGLPTSSVSLCRFSDLETIDEPSFNITIQNPETKHPRGADQCDMLQLDKECLVERLVLEDVMESIFTRCLFFSVILVFLISMMWMSYPSSSLHLVHQSIISGYDLTGSFSEVKTVEDIQSYLTKAATMSHAFSPSSVNHIKDVQSKSYIHSPRTLPPVVQLKRKEFPTLTTNFTLTVWVKTKVQLDTIIRKEANGLTCWSLGPEAVIFGEHDSFTSEIVVNPWAKSIYRPGVMRADVWKVSEIRRKVSDDKWHNLGFRVNASHIDFVYDGNVTRGESSLHRPMTDCPGGTVAIGSKYLVAEMTDLVFFNRYLGDEELRDTFVAGRPISVMLSGSGPVASEEEYTLHEQLADMDTSAGHRFHELKASVEMGQRNTVLELLKRFGTSSAISDPDTGAGDTGSGDQARPRVAKFTDDSSPHPTLYDFNQTCLRTDNSVYTEPVQCRNNSQDAIALLVTSMTLLWSIKAEVRQIKENHYRTQGSTMLDEASLSQLDTCVTQVRECIYEKTELFANLMLGDIMRMTEASLKDKVKTCSVYVDGNFDNCMNSVISTFLHYLQSSVLLVQQENCRVRKAYRDTCPVTCGLPCDASPIPKDPIVPNHESDQCSDAINYMDSWGYCCQFYQLHDKKCEHYANDETRKECRLTCNTFEHTKLEDPGSDTKPERFFSVEKLNALLVSTSRDDMMISRNMAHGYVAYYCCLERESRGETADESWRKLVHGSLSCDRIKPSLSNGYSGQSIDLGLRPQLRHAFASDYPECFPSGATDNALAAIGFPKKWLVESGARNIIARIFVEGAKYGEPDEKPRHVIFSGRPGGTRRVQNSVQLITRDSMRGNEWSLTVDNPEWRWKPCTQDLDCTTVAFACQTSHYNFGICKTMRRTGFPPQKQFCSPTCWTGGCNRTLLKAGEKVCQPCDACVGETCSEACDGKAGIRTDFDATSYQMKLDEYKRNVTKWNTHEARDNTFSISAWVKDFHFQRILEKRVNVTLPPAHEDSEGYDKSTNTLTCYSLSYSEFCFRTHWYDKRMTCVPNPLVSMLQDDKWHHVTVVKAAVEKTPDVATEPQMKTRVDDVKFFIDAKESASTMHESVTTGLAPYAASDCGGPMVSTVEITHARDDATFGKDGTAFAHQLQHYTRTELIHLLPLGGSSTAVLRFVGLGVPKHAVIKDAYLELSAVQSPVQQAIERVMCGTRMGNNSSTEPINLRIFSPRVDVLQHPCSPYHEESACTEKGCRWVEGQCTSGVFGRPCSPWKGANAMLNSDAIRHTFVGWDIDTNNWRRTNLRAATIVENGKSVAHGAFESPAYDTATETGSVRISPDVSAIVKDILARDSYDPKDSVATFALQGPDVSSNKFFFTCDSETDYLLDAESDDDEEMDTCAKLQHLSDRIDARFPLFALSKDGATKVESGSAPRLRVYWCHTEDCISPTFAGAGDDVKWGKLGFTVPPSHPDLGPPPRVEDPKISAPATPIYNGIPYMVFGASTTGDQDPVSEGKMFDLRTMPKAMTLGEAQKAYYSNIKSVPNLPGPERTIDAQSEQSQLDVSAYSKEVFSIAPPILLQRRNLGVPCRELVPALGSAMTQYFNMQIDKQCMNGPYTCNFPNKGHHKTHNDEGESGFTCVDRNQYVTSGYYFGRNSITLAQKGFFFPEFLEVMNLRTVYRKDTMLATKNWVDLESETIELIGVFLAPGDRVGTVMQLEFKHRGGGHVNSSYSLSSFKQMSPGEQTVWIILACAIMLWCFIEMCAMMQSGMARLREKKKWQLMAMNHSKERTEQMAEIQENVSVLKQEFEVQEEARQLQWRMKLISTNSVVCDCWDVFDVGLRVIIFVFLLVYVAAYFSSALHFSEPSEQLGLMEGYMKDILLLNWHSENISYTEKVQNFVNLIRNIVVQVNYLRNMRVFSAVLILLCLFRLIVYMRVHPKVAILYKTIAASVDDLFHFALTFSFLYFVLAFVATWTFGAIDERFATFGASCYEQFNMIIGEFPMDPVAELQGLYIAYLFVFCVLMFLIVMNFFLAIIIDSYSAVKDQVDECTVSKNFVADVYHTFAFYYYRWKGNWPSRKELIKIILRADMNHNLIHDQELAVPVTPKCLVANYIFPDLDSATSFVTYYLRISHNLAGSKKRDKSHGSLLEHHLVLKRLLQLDLLSDDWHGLHREVHPLGRRVDETKMLIRQLMRTGQKILNALRINKTQFARDQLLQDGDMADEMTVGKRNTKGLKDSINVETANSFSLPSQSIESRTSMASNQAP